MIGKAESISHTKNALNYAAEKLYAKELMRHDVAGDRATEIARDFRVYQRLNQRCEKNTIQFVLSPAVEDGQRLSDNELREIVGVFLKEMQLLKHQWIAYTHQDRAHKHVHIYVNRIDSSGKAFPDSFLSNRASQAAQKVAYQYGLTQASEVAKMKREQKAARFSQEISFIKYTAQQVFALDRPTTEHRFVEMFNKEAAQQGVRAEACYNKDDAFRGLRFFVSTARGEEKLKASEVDKQLSKKQLLLQFQTNLHKQNLKPENEVKNRIRSRFKL